MAKGYWIAFYRAVKDPERLARYAKAAGPVIEAGGGRFLARGEAAAAWEAGRKQRVVVIEFESAEKAIATYESPEYRAALAILGDAAERDLRIVGGV